MCPFCKRKLAYKIVSCPNNIRLSCLHCEKCRKFYYSEKHYKMLTELASDNNEKLNKNVFEYKAVEPKKKKVSSLISSSKTSKKSKKKPKSINKSGTLKSVSDKPKIKIDENIVKDCTFYKNKKCQYFDDSCNPYSVRCRNLDILLQKSPLKLHDKSANITPKGQSETTSKSQPHHVRAIILSYNRKCIYAEHDFIDVTALLKVLLPTGDIIDVTVPAAYCKECDQYIITKADFKNAKQKGVILCQVEDKTSEYLAKHKKSYSGTESRIHSLGYNVIKQYGYTYGQRKIILANIIENYNISKHEILSMLDMNISRKMGLPNYEDAVYKWKQDRDFIVNYHTGDIPQVIVDKVIVGKRE